MRPPQSRSVPLRSLHSDKPIQLLSAAMRLLCQGTTQSSGKEAHFAEKPLVPHPNEVTLGSSMHPVLGELGPQAKEEEIDMMAGIKHDSRMPTLAAPD
ncbi:hypothetical protein MRB53_037290 [Persea americana]|nr:hypothetical protein MRB53_037290 [Persea americana]